MISCVDEGMIYMRYKMMIHTMIHNDTIKIYDDIYDILYEASYRKLPFLV